MGKTRHGFQNHRKQEINSFSKPRVWIKIWKFNSDKNIWELFLFKYIIPKYLRRIWINKIRFEKITSDISKRMWQSVSSIVETYRKIYGWTRMNFQNSKEVIFKYGPKNTNLVHFLHMCHGLGDSKESWSLILQFHDFLFDTCFCDTFWLTGDEFQENERGISLERAYIQNYFSDFTQLLWFENYRWCFESYFFSRKTGDRLKRVMFYL